jgi:hypothetical protein
MSEAELSKLSRLQKALLKKGLEAHCVRALDIAYGIEGPGSFGIATMMKEVEDRRERARRRAAAGKSIDRLIGRGLLESCGRGSWRLTSIGFQAGKKLYPGVRELSARELEKHNALREMIDSWIHEHPWLSKRRRSKTAKSPQVNAPPGGVEVDF